MNNDFVAEILRAAGSLRSGDPAGVTAIIRNALSAAGLTSSAVDATSGNPKSHHPRTSPAAGRCESRSHTLSVADRSAAEAPERGRPHTASG